MKKLLFPDLYCPFPSQINKYADVLEDYALEWVLRFNLLENELAYQRFTKAKFYLMTPICYPYCEIEELKIANDWLSWMMSWDIKCETSNLGKEPDRLKLLHKRFIEVLSGAELKSDDVSRTLAFYEMRQRILQRGGAKWMPNFVRTVELYLYGCYQEANFQQTSVPDIEEYINLRRLTGAMEPFLELIEFCDHLILPEHLKENRTYNNLRTLANDVGCVCNDIFSASKEIANGEFHNLVSVLNIQEKLSLKQSFKRAVEIHNQLVEKMISLEKSMPSFDAQTDCEVTRYILALNAWIVGHYNWYFLTGRYETVENRKLVNS